GAALIGIAVVSLIFKVDSSGAVPATVFLLAAILLIAQDTTFSEIPWHAFLLAGCTPLTIGLMALPPFSRMTGLKMHFAFWILALGPTIAAIALAVRAESLVSDW